MDLHEIDRLCDCDISSGDWRDICNCDVWEGDMNHLSQIFVDSNNSIGNTWGFACECGFKFESTDIDLVIRERKIHSITGEIRE